MAKSFKGSMSFEICFPFLNISIKLYFIFIMIMFFACDEKFRQKFRKLLVIVVNGLQ